MTNAEFLHAQKHILRLTGRELALRLGSTPASVSRWADSQPIPDTIALLMDRLVIEHLGKLVLPLPLEDLLHLSRAAASRGITVEALLLELIRSATETGQTQPTQMPTPPPRSPIEGAPFVANTGLNKPAEDI